jgi:hypothetical protein
LFKLTENRPAPRENGAQVFCAAKGRNGGFHQKAARDRRRKADYFRENGGDRLTFGGFVKG